MFKLYFILLIALVAVGCKKQPVELNHSQIEIESITNNVENLKVYRLPEGMFREIWWEFKEKQAFELCLDKDGKDFKVYIPVPSSFLNFCEKEITGDWNITAEEPEKSATVTYLLNHKYNDASVKIQLPVENNKRYCVAALEDTDGNQLVMFMNLTNYIIHRYDKGIFGYFILKPMQPTSSIANEN